MLIDSIIKHVKALKVMNFEINDLSENLLTNIISQKLDKITSKKFEKQLTMELSNRNIFITLLQDQCLILENSQGNSPQIIPNHCRGKLKTLF